MADLYQEITEWSGGAQAAGPADRIPLNSTPKAHNTAFRNIGSGIANLGQRPGLAVVNATALTSSPAVIYQRLYSYSNVGVYTNYLVTLCADGNLYYKNPANTYTAALAVPANFPSPSTLCFTAAANLVDGTVMANRLFLLNDASERRSLIDQTYYPWGLSPIATWSAASAATGANSMPNETFDVTVSSYHTTTAGESGLATPVSAVVMGGANRRIQVDITPTAAESAQYTSWRVYLRRQTTQAKLYHVQTLYNAAGAVLVSDGNVPIATTTAYVDIAAATIANLTTEGVTDGSNDPPPTGVRFVTTYNRRLFVADQRQINWSKQDKPDAFDPLDYELVDTGEGDRITGIRPFSDDLLLITTTTAIYGLFGNDPQTWVLRPIDSTIGCASHLSMVEFDKKIAWWSETDGPVVYDGTSIERIGLDKLGVAICVENVEPTRLSYISAGQDYRDSRVVWTVPLRGATARNTQLLPYNYRLKQFEATEWTPMDIASLSAGYTTDGSQRLFAGNYAGQVCYFDSTVLNDGILTGPTHTVTFTPATSSITTIAGTGFNTAGAGLAERYVVIADSSFRPLLKVRIASNTSTALTLAAATTSLTVGVTYTAYIGSIDFRLYTKWMDLDQTFIRKRFDRAYVQINALGNPGDIQLATQINFINTSQPATNIIASTGAVWDSAIWDTSTWAGSGILKKRIPLLKTGQTIRVVLYHFEPDQDMIIHTIGVLGRAQSDRYYG